MVGFRAIAKGQEATYIRARAVPHSRTCLTSIRATAPSLAGTIHAERDLFTNLGIKHPHQHQAGVRGTQSCKSRNWREESVRHRLHDATYRVSVWARIPTRYRKRREEWLPRYGYVAERVHQLEYVFKAEITQKLASLATSV